ncbi:MAG: hypothetical protein LBL00_00925 [Endomicrobium sp.]|jgi:hypothetical protein|nr:hypothetical protein [Endomicrobium sp.]
MKKIKKIISWLAAAAIVCNACSFSFAATKRDVNDPVLREIINELSRKIPKFIDKYGETVFVEDEPITRGALISAIYEYDKRTKTSTEEAVPVSQITRQEFDALRAKITTLEKSKAAPAAAKSSGGNIDIIALIADLEPNMPMLLDNSLKNSKVFKSLQQQVAEGGVKPLPKDAVSYAAVSKDMKDMNVKLEQFSKRLDSTEANVSKTLKAQSAAEGGAKSLPKDAVSYAAVSKDIKDMNVKLEQFSKRLDLAEGNSSKTSKAQTVAGSSVSQKEVDDLKNNLNQIQQSYIKLSKRIDELNDRPIVTASSAKSSPEKDMVDYINRQLSDIKRTVAEVPTSTELRNEINKTKSQTQADIKRIERRLNNISDSAPSGASSSGSSSGSHSGTTIATISLGITMIAALFVAR